MDRNAYQEGQEAFQNGLRKIDCPSHLSKSQQRSWKEGWRDAEIIDRKEQEENEWFELSKNCPWYTTHTGYCAASQSHCMRPNCAIMYFKENANN